MNRRSALLAASALLVAASLSAEPLALREVSGDADWLLHIDVEKLVKTKMGAFLLSEQSPADLREQFAVCERDLGFHPLRDMRNVTLYGVGTNRDDGIALFHGQFNPKSIVEFVRKRPGFRTVSGGARPLYEWTDESSGQPLALCLPSTTLLVLGSPAKIGGALDILDGKRPSLAARRKLSLPDVSAAGFLVAAQGQAGALPLPGALRSGAGGLTLGENADGNLQADLRLTAESEEKATQTQQMIQGLLMAAMLTADQNPDLATLARGASVSGSGTSVNLSLRHPVDKVIEILRKNPNPFAAPPPSPGAVPAR